MTNKDFKQMIKKHQVKQSFCRLLDATIYRFYINTVTSDLYVAKWFITDNHNVAVEVQQMQKSMWDYQWHKYFNDCLVLRERVKQETSSFTCGQDLERYPMQQRKFWKLWYSTINFMLHDTRVEA